MVEFQLPKLTTRVRFPSPAPYKGIVVSIDKNLKFQQSIHKFDLKFIILLAIDNKHQTLQPYVDKVKVLLNSGDIPKISEITLD